MKEQKKFKTYGKALKWALNQRGVSQSWLARKAQIDKGTVSKYVNDEMPPPRERRIIRFNKLLGVQIEKQPNGMWAAYSERAVDEAFEAVSKAKEQADAYKVEGKGRDEILQSLELAQRLLGRCHSLIEDLKQE